jgi:hypothetical protein
MGINSLKNTLLHYYNCVESTTFHIIIIIIFINCKWVGTRWQWRYPVALHSSNV